jgi:hypothetical protein
MVVAVVLTGACARPEPPILDMTGVPPPKPAQVRKQLIEWAQGFFIDPVRDAALSDPLFALVTLKAPQRVWVVCLEYSAKDNHDGYLAPQRLAFGFGEGATVYAPLRRGLNPIPNTVCDHTPLSWRAFPEIERAGNRPHPLQY